MPTMIENPLHRLTPEQLEEIGASFQKIHDEVYADLGEHDAATSARIIEFHRRLAAHARIVLMASRYWPAWVLGTTGAVGRQDPREHGDRPQHPARPVGLDERPEHPLLDVGLGHGLARLGLEALPQLRPPHLHEHRRQGQGRRLRDHAHRPAAEAGTRSTCSSRSTTSCCMLFFEWGVAVHDLDFEAITQGTEVEGSSCATSSRRSASKARRQIVKDYIAFPLLRLLGGKHWKRRLRQPHRELRPQPLVLRDHLLRPLPRPGLHVHRGGGRGRDPRRLVRPPAARRRQHRGQRRLPRDERQPLLPGRAPPLPRHAELALRADRARR